MWTRRGLLATLLAGAGGSRLAAQNVPSDTPHLGNLYPLVQQLADSSEFELSYLHPKFRNLSRWKSLVRPKVFQNLFYSPEAVPFEPQVIRRTERPDYIEEYLTFRTSALTRVPAYLLVPRKAKVPAPGIVVLHSHDGIYLWGKEKVVATDNEHPWLANFKQQRYGGKSIAGELAQRGYVTIAIDMPYWGERRMLLEDDPASYRDRPASMSSEEIAAFNRRASQNEQLFARSLFTAGVSWPGLMLWDDIRTLDYLASRPEVDAKRLGCAGLSVGGYRSFMLAALDERIRGAVDVGWMTSFGSQIRRHVINSMGLSFMIPGLYRYFDLPDLAALIAPRAVMVINGSQDRLFPIEGVKAAFSKIEKCYNKAGAPDRQKCLLFDAPHEFNLEMQKDAWEWLARWV
jgi:dienelactone hydrolase